MQRRCNTGLVAHLPGEGETLSAQRRGTSVVPLVMGKDACAGQSLGTSTDEGGTSGAMCSASSSHRLPSVK